MTDNGQQVSKYSALLSDQNFNFTPYFDKAVEEWLHTNMETVLKEQPYACKFFIRDTNHRRQVAEAIPLTEDYKELRHELLSVIERSNDAHAFYELRGRMIAEKMADELYENAKKLSSAYFDVITNLSDSKFQDFLADVEPKKFKVPSEYFHSFFSRLPSDVISKFVMPASDYHGMYYGNDVTKLISVIAQYIAFKDLGLLKGWLAHTNYGDELFCMCCANRGRRSYEPFKSKSGYTHHRRSTCDTEGLYPNLTDIIGKRLLERK